jgi:carbonic anhydrase/acetyltransferase-like protein (isoleucine patch superfamily)
MIHSTSFIAPGASIMGSVTLEAESSVWYQAVLRGDLAPITVGAQSNIQDGAVVHVDEGCRARSVGGSASGTGSSCTAALWKTIV